MCDNTDGELIYTITTTPGNGILYNNGVALGVSDTFSQSDIDAGGSATVTMALRVRSTALTSRC